MFEMEIVQKRGTSCRLLVQTYANHPPFLDNLHFDKSVKYRRVQLLAICWTIFPHWGEHFDESVNHRYRLKCSSKCSPQWGEIVQQMERSGTRLVKYELNYAPQTKIFEDLTNRRERIFE